MNNIDRAEQVIQGLVDHPETPEIVAQALADAGLLVPEPHIIRTREELAALDPQTVLVTGGYADPWTVDEINTTSDTDWFLPVAVLATGSQVREAQQALKEKE